MKPNATFRTDHRNETGLTLVEVVIAIAILALFATVAFGAFSQMNRLASEARLRTLATAMAQHKIEEVVNVPWPSDEPDPAVLAVGVNTEANLPLNDNALVVFNENDDPPRTSKVANLDGGALATRTTTITLEPGSVEIIPGVTKMRRIRVQVAYTFRGRPQLVELSTLRTVDDF
jgi:prepilin-type N-terminal cleavage/methylation domain-containing protein